MLDHDNEYSVESGAVLAPSRYNHEIALSDGHLLIVNLLRGTFVSLADTDAADWRTDYWRLPATRIASLAASGALISSDIDELAIIEREYQKSQHTSSQLQITIALTLECNLRCGYCYEERVGKTINRDVEERILRMVERQLPGKDYLVVTWYGGEPLICLDAIERMTRSFLALCARQGAHYKAMLVTNGLLLNEERVKRLKALGYWSNIQVTLDGPRECHDLRRPGVGGRPTYDRIVGNLTTACEHLPIKLRMNVDKENIEQVTHLVDDLANSGLSGKTSIYCSNIHDAGQGCRDLEGRSNGLLLDNKRLAEIEPVIRKYFLDHGFGAEKPPASSISCNCQAVSSESLLIGPEGEVYRCWLDVGKTELQVGTLDDPFCLSDSNLLQWIGFNPTKLSSCRECKLLPLCLGSCPRLHFDGFPESERCPTFKFNLDKLLLQHYEKYLGGR